MQKWEYLEIEAAYNRVLAINGDEVKDWQQGGPDSQGTRIHAYLNQLGDQGWELITVVENRYLFKRPKAG
jgi:hypothetical protein